MRALCCLSLLALGCRSPDNIGIPDGAADLSGPTSLDFDGVPADLTMLTLLDGPGGDLTASGLCCGQPGDVGNNLGVGKYCNGFSDCTGMANFCSNLGGDAQLHFCTMVCQMGGNCGTGAACQCQGGQCGCVPNSCLNMPSTC